MAMTTTPPSKAGWYWLRKQGELDAAPCKVLGHHADLVCVQSGFAAQTCRLSDALLYGASWSAEPIAPPGDVTAPDDAYQRGFEAARKEAANICSREIKKLGRPQSQYQDGIIDGCNRCAARIYQLKPGERDE